MFDHGRPLKKTKIGRFDQVRIITTRNVTYLSMPPNEEVSPKGIWSVAAVVDDELLLVKQSAVIRIPATDVLMIADYDIEKITSKLGKLSYGQKEEPDRADQQRGSSD